MGLGGQVITATYLGDSLFTSSYDVLDQDVQGYTKTTLTSSLDAAGTGLIFTASVESSLSVTPTGTVTFSDGTTTMPVTIDSAGQATWDWDPLPTGGHSVVATYSGDINYLGSYSNPPLDVSTTTTALSASPPSASAVGQMVTFTAVVSPASYLTGTPDGSVDFSVDGTIVDTATLDASGTATYSTSSLSLGGHTITAKYTGASIFTVSSTSLDYSVIDLVGVPIDTVEGELFSGTTATVTFPAGVSPSNYTANIDWGDGNQSAGAFVYESNGVYEVTGDNTYAAAGSYPVTITLTDTIGDSLTATTTATVADVPLYSSTTVSDSPPLTVVEQQPLAGELLSVSDLWPDTVYTATIDYGDGSAPVQGQVAGSAGDWSVSDPNGYVYADKGSYLMQVALTGTRNGVAAYVTFDRTVVVTDAALSGTASNLSGAAGQTVGSGPLATFTDADTSETSVDYSALIDWGDGGPSEQGIVAANNGVITVTSSAGGHTYAQAGTYATHVQLEDWGSGGAGAYGANPDDVDVYGTATVSASAPVENLSFSSAAPLTATDGLTSGAARLATFTDVNATLAATAFAAQVNWGDGGGWELASVTGGQGNYDVVGSHTYASAGLYPVAVSVVGPTARIRRRPRPW